MAEIIKVADIIINFTQDTPIKDIEELHKELVDAVKGNEYIKDVTVKFRNEEI